MCVRMCVRVHVCVNQIHQWNADQGVFFPHLTVISHYDDDTHDDNDDIHIALFLSIFIQGVPTLDASKSKNKLSNVKTVLSSSSIHLMRVPTWFVWRSHNKVLRSKQRTPAHSHKPRHDLKLPLAVCVYNCIFLIITADEISVIQLLPSEVSIGCASPTRTYV